uniref:Uncharacterized protein n=1 Tax=Nelumbo nucifera TaxID=4432 RepID=A0A822YLM7_NELNU|nr:TPA_asm: hypothetical protein HUJ06_012258 [Nelumbo nucifera]
MHAEMGMGSMKYYEDFEVGLLKETDVYYSIKASKSVTVYPHSDYMLKVDECLKVETGEKQSFLLLTF